MVFGDYCLLAGSAQLPLPSLQQQLMCIFVKEILQIKERERDNYKRGENRGSLEEGSKQNLKVLHVNERVGLEEMV